MNGRERGFTLVEILAVVAILGILATIGTVAMIGTLDRARQRRTMADLHTIAIALESYNTDFGFYPAGDGGPVSSISGDLEPTYVKPVPVLDGWSNPVGYASNGSGYTLSSRGGDSAPSLPWPGGPTHRTGDDIVLVNGQFYQWPEGLQYQ